MDQEQPKKDPFPRNAQGRLIAPDYVSKEGDRIMEELRKAKPRILDTPGGLDSKRVTVVPASPMLDRSMGSVSQRIRHETPFEGLQEENNRIAQSVIGNISFRMIDASTSAGTPPVTTYKVKVFDGKINGAYPTGMGSGNYVLTVANPETALIYAGVSFNPTTFAITSRFLQVSDNTSPPVSEITTLTTGVLYFLIGYTYKTANGTFTIWQTWLGDIYYDLMYGVLNAAPAIIPVGQAPRVGWLAVPL